MIGMPRSGSSVMAEAFSLQEELGWISNYVHRLPEMPWLSALNRLSLDPRWGWALRGKKKQDSRFVTLLRYFLPYAGDNYRFWRRLCGERMLWQYMEGETAEASVRRTLPPYMERLLKYQRRRRLFAKLNGPPRMTYFASIFPGASFVHVLRDRSAVVASPMRFTVWRKGGGLNKPWWRPLPQADVDVWTSHGGTPAALAAIQWRRVVEQTWREHHVLPETPFAQVRYEDFVSRPHETVSRLFAELGLSDSPCVHRYLDRVSAPRSMNYKFRSQLSPAEIESIERITGVTASTAGYTFDD